MEVMGGEISIYRCLALAAQHNAGKSSRNSIYQACMLRFRFDRLQHGWGRVHDRTGTVERSLQY